MPNASFDSLFYIVSSLLGFLVLSGIAVVSVLRGGGGRPNILFSGICLLGALLNADVALVSILPDEQLALYLDRAVHLLFVFSVPVYISFVHAFLNITSRRWLEKTAWLLSAAFLTIVPTSLYINGFNYYFFGRIARGGPLFYCFSAVTAFTVLYCLTVLYGALKRTADNAHKNRIKYILGGLGFSSFLLFFTILPVMGLPVYPLGNFSFIPALFLAFGVLKYDLLDIGVLIRKGVAYFALTGILTALYVILIFLFNSFFIATFGGNSFVLSLLLALVIVLLFSPLRELVQKWIDRIFFRGSYDYHGLLKKISGQLASLLTQEQIKELLINEIREAMRVERVLLIIKEGSSYKIFGSLEAQKTTEENFRELELLDGILQKSKLPITKGATAGKIADKNTRNTLIHLFDCLGVTLAIPLPAREGAAGMIFLGQKKSGELFVDEDLEILTTIANQAATAIENASSYEALQSFNRDLEKKVQERTAALQTALSDMEKAEQQLIRSESLAAIGQLVAGAAHELNNPLAGAMSLVQSSVATIAEGELTADDRQGIIDDLRFAIAELRRSAGIICSLLDLSRQTQTYVEPVEMNRVIDDALRVLYNQYKNTPVTIEKRYEEELPPVEGNFANLGQVMINVIQNALQSLPEGKGQIILTTSCQKRTDKVFIECADNGAGIPAAVLNDIFKPFFTTKAVGRGTGLGLYISHEIIRRHDGRIDVESEAGKGTVIKIEIPCRRRAA
ncbi:MAG: GAF domain-containing protein [Syntrophobacterales bacterium]|nr:GAF domain-containing protein [Syntrophobacterales bacterium]